jgi:hypothetical protein
MQVATVLALVYTTAAAAVDHQRSELLLAQMLETAEAVHPHQ